MPTVLRKTISLFAVFLALAYLAVINLANAQTKAPQSTPETPNQTSLIHPPQSCRPARRNPVSDSNNVSFSENSV